MSEALGATLLILGAIALIFWIGPAVLASWLAEQRGRAAGPWFLVALLLGPLTVVAVGLSPVAYPRWCTECREGVAPDARRCPHCGASLVSAAAAVLGTSQPSSPLVAAPRTADAHVGPSSAQTPERRRTGLPVQSGWSRIPSEGAAMGRWRVRGSDYPMIDEGAVLNIRDERGAIGLYRQDGQKSGLLFDGDYVLFTNPGYPGHVLVGTDAATPILLLERVTG